MTYRIIFYSKGGILICQKSMMNPRGRKFESELENLEDYSVDLFWDIDNVRWLFSKERKFGSYDYHF